MNIKRTIGLTLILVGFSGGFAFIGKYFPQMNELTKDQVAIAIGLTWILFSH